jgi:hypothetical protein
MNRHTRIPLFALALAAAFCPLAAGAQHANNRGVDVDDTAQAMINADAAADAARKAPTDETTDEAEAPLRPARVGQVSVEEVTAADSLPDLGGESDPAADAALDADGDGTPDDAESAAEREEQ